MFTCSSNTSLLLLLLILLHAYSSPRGLGALQQLLNDSLPTLSVLTLSPPVTCQTHRIQVIPCALIPNFHRPASSAYSLYGAKQKTSELMYIKDLHFQQRQISGGMTRPAHQPSLQSSQNHADHRLKPPSNGHVMICPAPANVGEPACLDLHGLPIK
jgi:hypothetical protein